MQKSWRSLNTLGITLNSHNLVTNNFELKAQILNDVVLSHALMII